MVSVTVSWAPCRTFKGIERCLWIWKGWLCSNTWAFAQQALLIWVWEVYACAVVIEARWVLRPGCPPPALPSDVGVLAWASLWIGEFNTGSDMGRWKSSPISASSQGPALTGSAVLSTFWSPGAAPRPPALQRRRWFCLACLYEENKSVKLGIWKGGGSRKSSCWHLLEGKWMVYVQGALLDVQCSGTVVWWKPPDFLSLWLECDLEWARKG